MTVAVEDIPSMGVPPNGGDQGRVYSQPEIIFFVNDTVLLLLK